MIDHPDGADPRPHVPDDHEAEETGAPPGDGSGSVLDDEPAGAPSTRHLPAMRLFVRRLPAVRRPLELLRLDTWGDTLLGTKLRGELATGYAILLAICMFEICAWTLLFNYILQGAEFTVSITTAAAVMLGMLWGIGIFTIDKNLITSDLLRPGWGKLAGVGARVTVVLGSAYLTAQPIEQLVFRPMIEEQLKQEALREEAVARVKAARDKEQERKTAEAAKPQDDPASQEQRAEVAKQDTAVESLKARRNAAMVELSKAEAKKRRMEGWRSNAQNNLKAEQDKDPESDATTKARQNLQYAESAVSQAMQAVADTRTALMAAQEELKDGNAKQHGEKESYNQVLEEARLRQEKERQRLQADVAVRDRFFARFREATYGAHLEREDHTEIKWRPAGAMERAAILARIRDGEPPRWPQDADRDMIVAAANVAGLGGGSPSEHADRAAFKLWLLILLVAGAIPALSVFYKLTTSSELKLYYSVEAQGAAGNAEAVALLRAQRLRETRNRAPASSAT